MKVDLLQALKFAHIAGNDNALYLVVNGYDESRLIDVFGNYIDK